MEFLENTYQSREHYFDNAVEDYFDNLNDSERVGLYNIYADKNRYETIHYNSDDLINEFFTKPSDALNAITSDYSVNHDWAQFGVYGLDSSNDPTAYYDREDLIADIYESPEDYDIELEEFDEEE